MPASLGRATRSKLLALSNAQVATLARSRTRPSRLFQTLRARASIGSLDSRTTRRPWVSAETIGTIRGSRSGQDGPGADAFDWICRRLREPAGRVVSTSALVQPAAEGRGKGKRIGGGQPIGPRADEECVKCQGAGPAAVVASLGMNVHDHPRAALETKREEAVGRAPARRWLAVPLADGSQLGQPFGTAARRVGQHGVAAMPEREAAVDGLLESDFESQRDHERETWLPRALHSGRLSVGIWKSEANTKVVFPPLVGVMVPDKTRMARGSPCRLWST